MVDIYRDSLTFTETGRQDFFLPGGIGLGRVFKDSIQAIPALKGQASMCYVADLGLSSHFEQKKFQQVAFHADHSQVHL
jgi:hypothetical protein